MVVNILIQSLQRSLMLNLKRLMRVKIFSSLLVFNLIGQTIMAAPVSEAEPEMTSESAASNSSYEPPRGTDLMFAGKAAFIGGIAGLALMGMIANAGYADDGRHINPIVFLGALGSAASLAASPFLYFPGLIREKKYERWERGSLALNTDSISGQRMLGESARNRRGKWFGQFLNFAGSDGGLGNSRGIILSGFVNDDRLIELNLASSEGSMSEGGAVEQRLNHQLFSIRMTQFLDNSFYLTAGIGYRSMRGTIVAKPDAPSANVGLPWTEFYKVNREDIGLDFAGGNRWQWNVFSWGIDWIGIYRPMKKISESNAVNQGLENKAGSSGKKAKNQVDTVKMVAISALKMYLGTTF